VIFLRRQIREVFIDLHRTCKLRRRSEESQNRIDWSPALEISFKDTFNQENMDAMLVKKYMQQFEDMLKQYNKNMDFKLGLNKMLIDKSSSSKSVENLSTCITDYGFVVERYRM